MDFFPYSLVIALVSLSVKASHNGYTDKSIQALTVKTYKKRNLIPPLFTPLQKPVEREKVLVSN